MMNSGAKPVRFGNQSEPNDRLYSFAANIYERPFRLKDEADAIEMKAKQESSPVNSAVGRLKANAVRFAAMCSEHDYDRQSEIHIGRFRFKIPNPPTGALLAMLYVSTIPPRMYQAYRRGKKEHDYREVGDVMRRDIISVTVFLFGLGVLKKILAKRFQNHFKVNLLDKSGKKVLSYSQFSNYRITSLNTLKGILKEGNEEGLRRAINRLHDHNVAKLTGDHRLNQAIDTLKAKMTELSQVGQNALHRDEKIETVYKAMQHAEAIRTEVRAKVLEQSTKSGVKLAENLKEPLTNALEVYAKHARLPSDMISFAMVAVLLGWFPVWFNKTWNQLQYNRKAESNTPSIPTMSPTGPELNPFNTPSAIYPTA